ncbi:MAG: fasciclin domain-containing protein [Bacteroidales bacterium]|nr:fasciclin domain-containing protein [Bacteroidales bacterium]
MKRKVLLAFLISLILVSCKREFGSFYDPPKGQKGEIYEQLAADPSLSTFVSAIDMVPGLKDELSASSLYTVMAPDNDAFDDFFANHPTYNSLEDIPDEELASMVKFHIMKWMLFQYDFLNPGTTRTEFSLFKYETRTTTKYTDTSLSGAKIPLYYAPKRLQVYTPNYLSYANVTPADYSDVYGAGLETTNKLNVMGAAVKSIDHAAGNGCYFVIDKVLTPPNNIAQEIDLNPEYSYYNQLLKRYFLSYDYNKAGTLAQGNYGDIDNDGVVDSLFVRTYETDINLDAENPIAKDLKPLSLTAFIPTAAVFQNYLNTRLLPKFQNNIDSVPAHTLSILFKSHITNHLDWPSQVEGGMVSNILGDRLNISRADIASIKMASNGLFYTTNKVVEPKIFNAVPGPSFFAPEYWYFAEMLVQAGISNLFNGDQSRFTVLAPTNAAFNAKGIAYVPNPQNGKLGFFNVSPAGVVLSSISTTTMAKMIGNHILVNESLTANDLTTKEDFYKTNAGSYILTKDGHFFGENADHWPSIIDPDHHMSNGYFHGIDSVIMYPQLSLYLLMRTSTAPGTIPAVNPQYRKFMELCSAAGILSVIDFANSATSPTATPITSVATDKRFTLFCPSNDAIIAAQVAGKLPKTGAQGTTTLSAAQKLQLISYLKYFFVANAEIFTNGEKIGTFETVRQETNGDFRTITVSLPAPDLTVTASDGTVAHVIPNNAALYPQNKICSDGVVHIIDNAFTSQY